MLTSLLKSRADLHRTGLNALGNSQTVSALPCTVEETFQPAAAAACFVARQQSTELSFPVELHVEWDLARETLPQVSRNSKT